VRRKDAPQSTIDDCEESSLPELANSEVKGMDGMAVVNFVLWMAIVMVVLYAGWSILSLELGVGRGKQFENEPFLAP
jgi:hypothetical protein